jgi:DNA mismatch repair ATPase MutS
MRKSWKERIGIGPRTSYTFEIHPRDDAGHAALTELCNRGINLVANALAQSSDHILSFFSMFVAEIGFYVSCLNLHDLLLAKNEPVCMPVPAPSTSTVLSFKGIYDVCLALRTERRVVGNEANADEMSLVMITGANSGGKSTLLRSIGLAQLMMQCGMFVSAEALRANVGAGLFTHFIREEDDSMTSGKLDEELARMSMIADQIAPRCMVLFNESFAATNEREGSEIARQIISALLEAGVKVLVVTHQFTLASAFYAQKLDTALFLRAERAVDGRRSFKLVEGEPLPTSFSVDLYRRVGGFEKVAVANTASVDGLGAIEVGTSEADSTGSPLGS